MPEEKKPSPAGQPEQESKKPAYVPPASREKRQRSVVHYVAILFAAAFLLMLLTYLMDRRQNEQVVDSLNQSVSGLRESLSSMQSVQDVYEDNQTLLKEVEDLETQVKALQEAQSELNSRLDQQTRAGQAMDWFWQINEAYVKGQYSKARDLIQRLKDAGLDGALPQESVTDNGRFSPADRYQEIYNALY